MVERCCFVRVCRRSLCNLRMCLTIGAGPGPFCGRAMLFTEMLLTGMVRNRGLDLRSRGGDVFRMLRFRFSCLRWYARLFLPLHRL